VPELWVDDGVLMSKRGINSDLTSPEWLWPTYTGEPKKFEIGEFQKKHLTDPREFLVMMSTPARTPSTFYEFYENAVLGVPYKPLGVGDTGWTFRGGVARCFEIARFEDGGVVDTEGRWYKHAYESAEAAEEAANRRKQWKSDTSE
jgi:hypothetical protein